MNEIIVVEGRDDENAVKAAVDAEVIVTGGYHISRETFDLIRKAYEGPGIVILTDPDSAGEAIRRRLTKDFPHSRQAHLVREEAIKGNDIGVENASAESIVSALKKSGVFSRKTTGKEVMFSHDDLLYFNLAGGENSAQRRSRLGKALGIGYANSKTFLARLNGFGISREEFYLHGHTLFPGNSGKTD